METKIYRILHRTLLKIDPLDATGNPLDLDAYVLANEEIQEYFTSYDAAKRFLAGIENSWNSPKIVDDLEKHVFTIQDLSIKDNCPTIIENI